MLFIVAILPASSLTSKNFLVISVEAGSANFTFPASLISPLYLLPSLMLYKTGSAPALLKFSITTKLPAVVAGKSK